MLAPPFLNMAKLRYAQIPGASMHASARALATFYHGVSSARLLPAELVDGMVAHREVDGGGGGGGGGGGVRWVAGFQVGACVDSSGRRLSVLGHGAAGGTVGLCVPEAGVVVAVTVSKLTPRGGATRRVVEAMLGEFGLRLSEASGMVGEA